MMLGQYDGSRWYPHNNVMAGEETTLKIIAQSVQAPGTAPTTGGIPTGTPGLPSPTDRGGVFQVFQEAFGDSLRDFGSNLTASVTSTLAGSLVGRATGSFTAAGAVSTIVGQTIRTIQTRAVREQDFASLPPEEQLIAAREEAEGRKLNPLEKLLARGEAALTPETGRKEAQAAGLISKNATGAASAAAKILPVAGAMLAAGLIATEGFKAVSAGLKNLEEDLAPFSGEIAAARANVEIRAIEGRIRRAEEFGPGLARLVETRGRFEESWEDFKAKILVQFLPVIEGGFNALRELVDILNIDKTSLEEGALTQQTFDLLVEPEALNPENLRIGKGDF